MLCPRCRRESKDGTLYCPGCGAPLSLRAEPEPPALDASLTLDRRAPGALRDGGAELDEGRVDDLPPLPPPLPPLRHAPAAPARPPAPATPPPARAPAPPPPPARPLPSGRSAPAARPGPAPVVVPVVVPAAVPRPAPVVVPAAAPAAAPARTPRPAVEAPRPPPPPLREDATVEVEVGPVEVHLRRAPTWKRALAWFSDGAPFAALFAVVLRSALDQLPHPVGLDLYGYLDLAALEARGITGPILAGVLILFGVYHALSHALAGATLGKRVLGLQVVGPTGARPGLARSAVRAVLALLSLLLLGLGVLLALFTRSGRALHDLLARTWVVEAP